MRYLLGCFVIVPINFLVTFAIFADFFRIFQAVSIKHVFYNIETKFATTFLLQLAILVEFVVLAKFAISPVYISDSSFL